jgi:phage shock protein A
MRSLESKISEARTKKDLYIARARSAQAAEKIQEMIGQLNTGSGLSAFDRMEEKVLQLEARSVALAELSADDLEQKFASLQDGGGVDAELAAMKAEMLTGSKQYQLPPTNSPANKNTEI